MDLARFETQLFFCTTRIEVPVSATEQSVGTGFLVQAPIDKDRHLILVISNKHVFVSRNHQPQLTFHKRDVASTDQRPHLGQVFTETIDLQAAVYVEHPDQNVDLACVAVPGITRSELNLYYRTLPISMAATFTEPWLASNSEVCFVGYPAGRYDQTNQLPILRRGTIATIPQTNFNGLKQFVIDAHVHKGSSGSPVFAIAPWHNGGNIVFLGVLTQTMIKAEQLQTIAAAGKLGVEQTIGLGLVLKVDLVRELIDEAIKKFAPNAATQVDPATVQPQAAV
jgi:hypothetical protein